MSIFQVVKNAVTVKMAAEHYGLQVNHNGMICCPFHHDEYPSMKVDERYYCFGCHETGDVIDFVGKMFNLTPVEAAKKIAIDFGLDPNTPLSSVQAIPFSTIEQNEQQRHQKCLSVMADYEQFLKEQKIAHAPKCLEAPFDPHFVSACHTLPYVSYLVDCLFDCCRENRKAMTDELLSDGTVDMIEDFLVKQKTGSTLPDAA